MAKIIIPKKLLIYENDLKNFRREASRAYPKEIYGILLGRELEKFVKIYRIIIPPIIENSYHYVWPDYDAIAKIIIESGMEYFGQLHSHPNAQPAVSPGDFKDWDPIADKYIGILSIRKRGQYKTTELLFWKKDCALPARVKKFANNTNVVSK